VIRDELVFPYREGTTFVRTLVESGGFAAVDRAFAAPPASTEQVLHPEKYAEGEAPQAVSLPDLAVALGEGWTLLRTNVLGEHDLRILIQQHAEPQRAAAGSAGWGGDRYAFLERADGARVLVLRSEWDSQEQADEFFQAYAGALKQRFEGSAGDEHDGGILLWSSPERVIQLARHGSRVELVHAPDRETLSRLNELLAAE
jgi:hypothetical protein